MNQKRGFTLIELLVVISIIAVLLSILMPSLKKAKQQTRMVICRSNLHQWGLIWTMFFQENDDHTIGFPRTTEYTEIMGDGMLGGEAWPVELYDYYQGQGFRFCPQATKYIDGEPWGDKNTGWSWTWGNPSDPTVMDMNGSYGMNDWAYSPPPGVTTTWGIDIRGKNYAKSDPPDASNAPLFLDCMHIGSVPIDAFDEPPFKDEWLEHVLAPGMIGRYVMDRHGNGNTNCLFFDISARKVGLKELWTLKWHRQWDTKGPYTLAGNGGTASPLWAEKAPWMVRFKDY